MLDENTKKRLYFYLLIAFAIVGALFLIFAVFLNRGRIEITAKSPYILEIDKLKNISCNSDICSIKVAPGKYKITLKKIGYKIVIRDIKVPFNQTYKENINFQFIPIITNLGIYSKKFSPILSDMPLSIDPKLEIPASLKPVYSPNNDYIFYIKRNVENFRQTLFMRQISPLKDEILITSFIRNLTEYQIIPSADLKKVAIIDNSYENSTVYIVDIAAKNRLNLFEYPLIYDLKWLPNSKDFLFEARAENAPSKSIFIYKDAKITELELKNSLKNIAILDDNRLIAATVQQIPANTEIEKLEGTIVTLGENIIQEELILSFIDYSLIANQGRLIKTLKGALEPTKIELRSLQEKTGLYFLQQDKLFLLEFEM